MRRACSSLLSTIIKSRISSQNATARLLSFAASAISPPSRSRLLPHITRTPIPPLSRSIRTSSSHHDEKFKEKTDIEMAFESATTADEILTTFAALESSLNDLDLGVACLFAGEALYRVHCLDHQKVLSFALRAFKIFNENPNLMNRHASEMSSLIAIALQLSGFASYNLHRFHDSLRFLNRASLILDSLEKEGSCVSQVRRLRDRGHRVLVPAKAMIERLEEPIRRCLERMEATFKADSPELGVACRSVAGRYAEIGNFKEALSLCRRVLEIHQAQLGQNSMEVAYDRKLLAEIYSGLEQHEEAMVQEELSGRVLKSWGMEVDALQASVYAANISIGTGKFDEAIKTLKGVVEQTDKESEARALVYITMAKAFMCPPLWPQEKSEDAKRWLEAACDVLEKRENVSPLHVAEAYYEVSSFYESMKEFEKAMSVLKRSITLIERLPRGQHVEGSVLARLGRLLLLTGKVKEAIPYLEVAAERMKESFGPKHFRLGDIYKNLEAACSTIGSDPLALEFQQKAINAWENNGPRGRAELSWFLRSLRSLFQR